MRGRNRPTATPARCSDASTTGTSSSSSWPETHTGTTTCSQTWSGTDSTQTIRTASRPSTDAPARYSVETGDIESAFGHLLLAGEEAEAFVLLRSSLVDTYIQGDGRALHRLAAKVRTEAATREPGRLADVALALAATAPAEQAAPWILRANNRAGDFDDADRARLVIARALVGVQYGEAAEVERALADYAGPKDMPEDEVAQYGPILLARTRLWLGDLNRAREICEQTLDPLTAPNLQQVALTGALAWVACVEGRLTEAEHLAAQALSGAEAVGLAAHTAMVDAERTRGRVAFERGDLVTAEHALEQSLSVSEDCRPAFALVTQLSLSRVWLADGRVGEALSGVERARAFLPPDSTSPLLSLCHALEGRIAIEIGDLDRATRCAETSSRETEHPCFKLGSSSPETR